MRSAHVPAVHRAPRGAVCLLERWRVALTWWMVRHCRTPTEPRCPTCQRVVHTLQQLGAKYRVLDEDVLPYNLSYKEIRRLTHQSTQEATRALPLRQRRATTQRTREAVDLQYVLADLSFRADVVDALLTGVWSGALDELNSKHQQLAAYLGYRGAVMDGVPAERLRDYVGLCSAGLPLLAAALAEPSVAHRMRSPRRPIPTEPVGVVERPLAAERVEVRNLVLCVMRAFNYATVTPRPALLSIAMCRAQAPWFMPDV